jgi:hypothetical protein
MELDEWKIEAPGSSETLLPIYKTTRSHFPEDRNFNIHSRGNRRSPRVGKNLWILSLIFSLVFFFDSSTYVWTINLGINDILHVPTLNHAVCYFINDCLHIQGRNVRDTSALKMEAAEFPETLITTYKTTRYHNPGDNLNVHCCDNLKNYDKNWHSVVTWVAVVLRTRIVTGSYIDIETGYPALPLLPDKSRTLIMPASVPS